MSKIFENGLIKSVREQNGFPNEKDSKSKTGSTKKLNGEVPAKKQKHLSPTNLSKKFESTVKKGIKRSRDELSDSDSDMPLAELQNCVSDDDDNVVLAKLNKAAKKLKKSHSQTKGLENRGTKTKSTVKKNVAVTDDDDDDDDISLAVIKKKVDEKQQNKALKKSSPTASPKKKVHTVETSDFEF